MPYIFIFEIFELTIAHQTQVVNIKFLVFHKASQKTLTTLVVL